MLFHWFSLTVKFYLVMLQLGPLVSQIIPMMEASPVYPIARNATGWSMSNAAYFVILFNKLMLFKRKKGWIVSGFYIIL